MRVSYTWLKELVEIPYTVQELGEVLTQQGMAVDALEHWGRPYENIVVGVVREVAKHPNADALTVCRVDVGKEVLQIVCGAPNVRAGQHVPVALIGARVGDMTIKKSKLRGVESYGMCCAADELGISSDHAGLLILDERLAAGTPFESVVSGEDFIYELDIPNNRPDLLSHIGIAREIWAHLCNKEGRAAAYELPPIFMEEDEAAAAEAIAVRVEAPALCPRYIARVIDGVRIGAAPLWMQARLYRLGMRPINNVVDITNYVMMEYGHPLHAFDGVRLAGRQIVVRRARAGEVLVTLDGAPRTLDEEMLVIADGERGIALAGVMGGENTEVTDATGQIVLESAYFDAAAIRRAAKLLNVHSESSRRFERGVRGAVEAASRRAAQLMALYAGGRVRRGMVNVGHEEPPRVVRVKLSRCAELLGMALEESAVKRVLRALGYECVEQAGGCEIMVPPHRVDVAESADIAEEIARLCGYERVPVEMDAPFRSMAPVAGVYGCRAAVRGALVAAGLYEAYNPSLVSVELLARAGVETAGERSEPIALANATTQEQSVLRTALYPGLLRNVQHNIAHGAQSVRLFELGRVYQRTAQAGRFEEYERCGLVLWGAAEEQGVWAKERQCDVYDMKGVVEHLLAELGIEGVEYRGVVRPGLHPGRTAVITGGSTRTEIGWLGELNPAVGRAWDVHEPVVVAELDVAALAALRKTSTRYTRLPRFPAATRDLALIVPAATTHAEIMGVIWQHGGPLLRGAKVFDRYQGGQVPEGHVSMAYHIEYRSDERTLTDAEVEAAHAALVTALQKELGAQVRA